MMEDLPTGGASVTSIQVLIAGEMTSHHVKTPDDSIRECRAEDMVTQTPGNMNAVEGQSVTLHCKYSTSDPSQYLFWYIQDPNDFPKYVLRRDTFGAGENADDFKGRFDAFLNKTLKTVPLTIQQTELCDSAMYYCALRPTVTMRY
ncbi:UNVERIFIED_CONTAM: hypothetical protein FKN15_031385 [Acipenser sinensis]